MSNERELGEHAARLDSVEGDIAEIRTDVKLILAEMHKAKGGWRTLMLVGGAVGAVGALVGKLLPFFTIKP